MADCSRRDYATKEMHYCDLDGVLSGQLKQKWYVLTDDGRSDPIIGFGTIRSSYTDHGLLRTIYRSIDIDIHSLLLWSLTSSME